MKKEGQEETVLESLEEIKTDLGEPIETSIQIEVPIDEEVREGVIQEDIQDFNMDSLLGKKTEGKTTISNSEQKPEQTKKEVFEEVKTAVYTFDMLVTLGSGIAANIFKKQINAANISATESQLKRLAEVAQPVYEKHASKMSEELILIVAIFGIYGFKIYNEFSTDEEDLPKNEKLEKSLVKQVRKNEIPNDEDWKGNTMYFQTGQKAGQLKPLK